MAACATVDRNAAASLGKAGGDATQALSSQTTEASKELKEVSEWWGIHDILACAKAAPSLRKGCVENATPRSVSPNESVEKLIDVLNKRKQAIDTLNQAYAAFSDLAHYDAGKEAVTALGTSFTDINSFLKAVSALPGAPLIKPISTTIEKSAAGIMAIIADRREDAQILAANADLKNANDALYQGLNAESTYMSNLLVSLEGEREALYKSAFDAGLISPTDILAPVFNQAYPGLHLRQASEANRDVVGDAAQLVLSDEDKSLLSATSKSYLSSLSTLHAVSEQHDRLANRQSLNIDQIKDSVSDLRVDLSQLQSSSLNAQKK